MKFKTGDRIVVADRTDLKGLTGVITRCWKAGERFDSSAPYYDIILDKTFKATYGGELKKIGRSESEIALESKFSQEMLQKAFDRICDLNDWKAPIDGFCRIGEMECVSAAIEHFTATKAQFNTLGDCRGWVRVKAIGYRNGPAGDK